MISESNRLYGVISHTRNTPIGVVVREPSAVNHYFCGVCPQIWGLGGT